jgi:hypothetical protein
MQLQCGTYACVSYSLKDAQQQQSKLNDYLGKNHLVPLEILQVGLMTDFFGSETEYFELQIRVDEKNYPDEQVL